MNEIQQLAPRKIQYLKWFDLLILTVLMFGFAIITSAFGYLDLISGKTTNEEAVSFSTEENYIQFIIQSITLLLAFLYLKWRKFDFKSWTIKPSLKGIGQAIGIFIIAALALDIYTLLVNALINSPLDVVDESKDSLLPWVIDFSTILHSLLNGFYEEIFFLGVCLALKPEYLKWTLFYSLIIRFSFHTYQGMEAALGIGFIYGMLMYLMYKKMNTNNIFAFGLAHSFADIIGLGILSYVAYGLKAMGVMG